MEDTYENIDKKYDIIEKKGSGASSIVFLVKDSTTKKLYAAKVLIKQNKCFDNEIEILNDLKSTENQDNQYIINLINNDTGNVFKKNKVLKEKQYTIKHQIVAPRNSSPLKIFAKKKMARNNSLPQKFFAKIAFK